MVVDSFNVKGKMTLLEQTEREMIVDIRERAFLFSPDGNTILINKEPEGERNEIDFSKEDPNLFDGNVLIHSHPNTDMAFRTFSDRDIRFFFSHKLKEFRMVKGRTVLSLVHEGNCSCNHDPVLILIELDRFLKSKQGVSECSVNEFLRSFSCLCLTKRPIDISS